LVFGHRGSPRVAPENTLASFETAADQGVDGVELDARLCATGELVVAHDPTLERVSGGADARAVADVAWDALRKVDLGRGAGGPLLPDALSLCRRARLVVNVELKRDVPNRRRVVAAAAALLKTWDPVHPVLVSSFDPTMLAAFRALAPDVPIALIVRTAWY